MRLFLAVIMLAATVAGCSTSKGKTVDIYTFKKERVDQEISGNQGYLAGDAPAPAPRDTKRTLIGIDVDMSGK